MWASFESTHRRRKIDDCLFEYQWAHRPGQQQPEQARGAAQQQLRSKMKTYFQLSKFTWGAIGPVNHTQTAQTISLHNVLYTQYLFHFGYSTARTIGCGFFLAVTSVRRMWLELRNFSTAEKDGPPFLVDSKHFLFWQTYRFADFFFIYSIGTYGSTIPFSEASTRLFYGYFYTYFAKESIGNTYTLSQALLFLLVT